MKKTPAGLKTTKAEIRARNAQLLTVAHVVTELLTIDERRALGLRLAWAGDESGLEVGRAVLNCLRAQAASVNSAKRAAASARSPLIGERHVATLARGIEAVIKRTTVGGREAYSEVPQWAWCARTVLDTAYMLGGIPQMETSDTHPGSRAGVVVVDLRDVATEFGDAKKQVTLASITARVGGKAAS